MAEPTASTDGRPDHNVQPKKKLNTLARATATTEARNARLVQLSDSPSPGEVLVAMLYPYDSAARDAYLFTRMLDTEARRGTDPISISLGSAKLLLNGLSISEVRASKDAAVKAGHVAGAVLKIVYELHANHVEEPSLRKAFAAYLEWALPRRFRDNSALPRSDTWIRHCWGEMRPVAQLWAALEWAKDPRCPYQGLRWNKRSDFEKLFGDPATFAKFLGVAKAMGEFATTFVPKRARPQVPLVDPDQYVRMPHDVDAIRLIIRASS